MENQAERRITKAYLDKLTYEIIGAAIAVHKEMGRGLLESVYHECMKIELDHRKINYDSEMIIKTFYRGHEIGTIFRCDKFAEKCVVVEYKAVKEFAPEHEAVLINYMKLLKAPKGILINFNCSNIFYEGQKTFVNEYYKELPEE